MPAHLFSSALFLPTPFFPSLSVSGTKFAYFSLLFTGSSQVLSPHIFLPVHQQLWVKAIASLCLFQRSTEHLVYNHQHQRYTSLAKRTLHAAPTSWELETHWDIVSDFWKQSLDCYLQNITLKAKFPYLEGRALPITHWLDYPSSSAQTTGQEAGSQVFIPSCSPLFRGNKRQTKSSLLGSKLHSAELHICTFVTHVLIWASSLWRQKLHYSTQLFTAW